MSRRTQLTTKYMFSALAQLSENFIFIYLGLTLFTGTTLYFKPVFILIAIIGITAARWCAVFPLSRVVNAVIRYRSKRRGREITEELPYSYQVMLFWAGLRGAVGVALAAGLSGANGPTLQATVLVVVVVTVIVFGGTTARMLEIMGIRTGVVDEIDSDDEFDIETATNGTYYKSNAVGFTPKSKNSGQFNAQDHRPNGRENERGSYSSGTPNLSPPLRSLSRNNSKASPQERERDSEQSRQSLLARGDSSPEEEFSDSDLPPAARQPQRKPPPRQTGDDGPSSQQSKGNRPHSESLTASGAIHQLFAGSSEEQAAWFKQLDEDFIKPKLLLDQNRKGGA